MRVYDVSGFAAAFERWEREYREEPTRFASREAMLALPEATLAEQRASLLVSYLTGDHATT